MAVNTFSKRKRNFSLSTNNNKNINSNENINNNNSINYLNDDIKIDNNNINDHKEKILINSPISNEKNEEGNKNENSIFTFAKQPRIEDFDKNTSSQKSINFLNSNQLKEQMNNKIDSQNIENTIIFVKFLI